MFLNQPLIKNTKFISLFIFILFALASTVIWTGFNLLDIENYNEWRIIEVLILTVINILGTFYLRQNHHYLKSKLILSLSLLFILGLASSYNSNYPIRAVRDTSLYISIAISCFFLALFIKENARGALYTVVYMSIIPIVFIIYSFFSFLFTILPNISEHPIYFLDLWQAHFATKRLYGDNALPIIFIIIGLFFTDFFSKYKNYLYIYLFLFLFLFLFMLTGGRGVFISFYVTIFIGFIFKPQLRYMFVNIIIISALSFIASYLFLYILEALLHK